MRVDSHPQKTQQCSGFCCQARARLRRRSWRRRFSPLCTPCARDVVCGRDRRAFGSTLARPPRCGAAVAARRTTASGSGTGTAPSPRGTGPRHGGVRSTPIRGVRALVAAVASAPPVQRAAGFTEPQSSRLRGLSASCYECTGAVRLQGDGRRHAAPGLGLVRDRRDSLGEGAGAAGRQGAAAAPSSVPLRGGARLLQARHRARTAHAGWRRRASTWRGSRGSKSPRTTSRPSEPG